MTLTDFIRGFFKRKGNVVFVASAVEKVAGLFFVIIATNFLKVEEYGAITYANTSLTFILPFIGFGIHQGLIRYGAISNSQQEKKVLFNIALQKGLRYSFILWLLIIIASPFVTSQLENAFVFLLILSIQIFSLYLLGIVKIYARLINRNTLYSKVVITNAISLVLSIFILTFYFKGIGYVLALVLAPLLVSIWFIYKLKLTNYNKLFITKYSVKELVIYGLQLSIANVFSQLLYAVDILLIGNILQSESLVAEYKIANVLPFSFLFLPLVVMTSDFVLLARKSTEDKGYIKKYYLNYLKIFSVISIGMVLFFYFFSENLYILFGDKYYQNNNLMFVFSVGVAGALLFRIPLGNMLSAFGWARVNLIVSIVSLITNIFLSYYLLEKYGIIGAAYATAFLMWFSGFLSLAAFLKYLYGNQGKLII